MTNVLKVLLLSLRTWREHDGSRSWLAIRGGGEAQSSLVPLTWLFKIVRRTWWILVSRESTALLCPRSREGQVEACVSNVCMVGGSG